MSKKSGANIKSFASIANITFSSVDHIQVYYVLLSLC